MQLCQVREQYVQWLTTSRDLSSHTIRAYDSDVAALQRYLGQCAAVEDLDREQLKAFIEAQRAAGLSSRSLRRRNSGVKGFCTWLVSCGLLNANPWIGLTVDLGRSRKLPRAVSSHDLDALLATLRHAAAVSRKPVADGALTRPHKATTLLAVALMVAAGLRVGEVVCLRQQDIDLPGRNLRVSGKGSRERYVFLTNDWIASLMSAYLTTRSALGIKRDRLLFNSLGRPLTAAAMRSRVLAAARDAGVQNRVTPHMLRHTAATQLIEAGVDIRYIQRLLGHASLTTTELYTHVSDFALQRVVSEVDILERSFIRGN